MRKFFEKNGITLIALVVTIIVLLILAGISINMVLGDNGVITKALDASDKTKLESACELVSLAWGSCELEYENDWANNVSIERSTYYTKEKMNTYLDSYGKITEEFTYNENGDTELTYKASNGTIYMLKVDKNGNVSKNQGMTISKTIVNLETENTTGVEITATVVGIDGKSDSDVTWSVSGDTGSITITGSGSTIIVKSTATEGTAVIKATLGEGYTEYDKECTVTVKTPTPQIASVGEKVYYYAYEGAEGEEITLSNLWKYLGREVTNYTGATSITIDSSSFKVSETYRLFFIDFNNDYGDGKGTIYLKADVTDSGYYNVERISSATTTDVDTNKNNRYLKFNRKWNSSGLTSLTLKSHQGVAWLLDPTRWTNLKDSTTIGVKDKINYVVGAPSLEMYVDSYNIYLTGYNGANLIKLKNANDTIAQKLKYAYVTKSTNLPTDPSSTYTYSGYVIGLEDSEGNMEYGIQDDYSKIGYITDDYVLIKSSEANGMYNPGKCYWLASPSANNNYNQIYVSGGGYSRIYSGYSSENNYKARFCPLVSLKSGVILDIASE